MSNIERINTNQRMSQIVKHNDLMYLSGQVGNKHTKDLKKQTAEVLEKVENLLKDAGTDKSKILSATIYIADINFFQDMNEVWDNWLPNNCAPARATVEAKLALPELLVEVCVIATE